MYGGHELKAGVHPFPANQPDSTWFFGSSRVHSDRLLSRTMVSLRTWPSSGSDDQSGFSLARRATSRETWDCADSAIVSEQFWPDPKPSDPNETRCYSYWHQLLSDCIGSDHDGNYCPCSGTIHIMVWSLMFIASRISDLTPYACMRVVCNTRVVWTPSLRSLVDLKFWKSVGSRAKEKRQHTCRLFFSFLWQNFCRRILASSDHRIEFRSVAEAACVYA